MAIQMRTELLEEAMIEQLAAGMREKLRFNRHKGSWYHDDLPVLLRRLLEEVGELAEELSERNLDYERIEAEAADVANYAGMILTVASEKRLGR